MVEKARVLITTPIDNKLSDEPVFDKDYSYILSCLSNGKTMESLVKEREEAGNGFVDDDIDPDFENVLRCLKEWGNSYLLEDEIDGFVTIINYEEEQEEYSCFEREFDQEPKRKLSSVSRKENGVPNLSKGIEIKSGNVSKSNSVDKGRIFSETNSVNDNYEEQEEEYTCSERECDQEPKRKLTSASKKDNGVCNQNKGVEIRSRNRLESNSGNKGGNFRGRDLKGRFCEKAVNFGTDEIEPDSDYLGFVKNCRIMNDGSLVCKYKGFEIVYCKKDEEKVKHYGSDSDESSSGFEIIDRAEFYKKDNAAPVLVNEDGCKVGGVGDFRQQVIANLKRPYDQNEYDKLWEDISLRKPKLHHKELRNGRELSCATNTVGKSYLQYFPDFEKLFYKSHDDEPRCLNLLRGFFFWLKNQVHDGSFKPWQDPECLSLIPGSC